MNGLMAIGGVVAPGRLGACDRVRAHLQLVHAGHRRDLGHACRQQLAMEDAQDGVDARANQCCDEEYTLCIGSSPDEVTLASQGALVAVYRRQAYQGGDLAAIELTERGKWRQQCADICRSYSLDRNQQAGQFGVVRLTMLTIDLMQLRRNGIYEHQDARLRISVGPAQAPALGHQHVRQQLPAVYTSAVSSWRSSSTGAPGSWPCTSSIKARPCNTCVYMASLVTVRCNPALKALVRTPAAVGKRKKVASVTRRASC